MLKKIVTGKHGSSEISDKSSSQSKKRRLSGGRRKPFLGNLEEELVKR